MSRLILFGATGDLARRKLFPALAEIGGVMPIVAVGRRPYTDADFFENHLPGDAALRQRVTYRHMDFTSADGYRDLFDQDGGNIVYLSVDPQAVSGIIQQIGALKLARDPKILQLVLEKPFGQDAQTASNLERLVETYFTLSQITRIDHYLLKDGVELLRGIQNENPQLGGKEISSLKIRILEREGIGTRGAFYSGTGAIRDILQNHLLNIAAVVINGQITAEFFKNLNIIEATFGQYEGYTNEPAVPTESNTETYVRVLFRLSGLSIACETGKALNEQLADISYKTKDGMVVNIEIQPKTGFLITGKGDTLNYRLPLPIPDAYVRLFERLFDNRLQNVSLDPEAIEAAWEIADRVATLKSEQNLIIYPVGSHGPA